METPISLSVPDVGGKELEYVTAAVKSGWLTHRGVYEPKFEAAFAEYCGKSCIATSSGTAALHLALLALGIGRGDEVILPALTFAAPASAVLAVGAKPVFVDINKENLGLNYSAVDRALNKNTKAIIPVHLYGENSGAHLERLFGIPVIEDSCESLGYTEPTGTITCHSFYGNKVITTGEGGMLVCDSGLLDIARKYRDGGFDSEYYHDTPGLNYRMTNMQAAIGCAQLERLPEFLSRRAEVLEIYNSRLRGRGKWLFVVDTDDPKELQSHMKQAGIETRPVFFPMHLMPPYRQVGDFRNAEYAWKHGLCLPTGTHLTNEQVHYICDIVEKYNKCPLPHTQTSKAQSRTGSTVEQN